MNAIASHLEPTTSKSTYKIVLGKEKKKYKPKKVNENGERLTAKGTVSKATGEHLKKYHAMKRAQKEEKTKPQPEPDSEEEESEEEEVDQYEFEEIQVKKKPEIVKEVVKEIIKPDTAVLKEVEELRERNKQLQDSFYYNNHLSRISMISKKCLLKF
jgi:hypothetical protein